MGLQSKLLMPVLLGGIILTIIVHFYWGPSLLQDKQQQLLEQHREVLTILGQGAVPSLLSDDLATLFATLDQQLALHQHSWLSLSLRDDEQKLLYPLFPIDEPEGEYLLRVTYQINWNDDVLGSLHLVFDSQSAIDREHQRIQQLELVSLLIFVLISLISLLWQKFFIVRPIQQLQEAVLDLGKGDYSHVLPVRGSDEIATLTRVFETMRNRLLKSNEELHQALELARESEYRQRTVLENTADGILSMDHMGVIISSNPAAEKIFGYSHEQMIGMDLLALLRSTKEISSSVVGNGSVPEEESRIEVESERPDGTLLILEMAYKSLELDGHQYFTAIVRDITESKRIEKIKGEFVSTVSHELRTPLTSIRGVLGLLAGGVLGEISDKGKDMLQLANNNVKRLGMLINDLLDIQKIEAGEMEFNIDTYDLSQLLQQCVDDNAGYAEQHKVSFRFETTLKQALVQVDNVRVSQILNNLLSNAAKFSPEGAEVVVCLQRSGEFAAIKVIDSGVGIPEEFHDKLFDKFTQHDASDTRSVGGTGLGLSITKSLVERLNGTIEFSSVLGEGTTFTICLPLLKEE